MGYEKQMIRRLDYRNSVLKAYPEVYTPAALEALEVLTPLNRDRRELMARRIARRLTRVATTTAAQRCSTTLLAAHPLSRMHRVSD